MVQDMLIQGFSFGRLWRYASAAVKPLTTLFLLLALTACANVAVDVEDEPEFVEPPRPAPPASWPATKKQREAINSWELRGRLGVQTAETGGSMDLNWRQDGDEYVIRLLAPMGRGSYLISGNMQSAIIRMPDGKRRVVENTASLFQSVLGVELPVSALRDWVRGVPAASLSLDSISWDEHGLLHVVEQAGWHVEMNNNLGVKVKLPHKIHLTREDQPELDIRLALRQWMIDN
ncbi:MAG TPA: outer membrane lipoprotein LolB [Thiotrichales bacterium]|nr:outer membrane lipoprotein LolB [Thiotrichales bacterium]